MGFRDGLKDLLSKTSRQSPPEQPPVEHPGGVVAPVDGEHSSADHDLILALTMSLQERDIARKLANAESCNMASAKRKSIIDSVMCDGLQHALSYKLWQDNCLEYTDIVPDGFYDAWGDFSDVVPSASDFPSLHDLRSIPRVAGDAREVLLVDHSADPGLCTAVEHLTELLNEDSSVRDKIQVCRRGTRNIIVVAHRFPRRLQMWCAARLVAVQAPRSCTTGGSKPARPPKSGTVASSSPWASCLSACTATVHCSSRCWQTASSCHAAWCARGTTRPRVLPSRLLRWCASTAQRSSSTSCAALGAPFPLHWVGT